MISFYDRALSGQTSFVAGRSKSILRIVILISLIMAAGFAASRAALGADATAPAIERVTTNGRANPLGISAGDISFGWSVTSAMRGTTQKAYQIRVGTSAGLSDVWDSGQVESDNQVDVRLPSTAGLQSATRYYWAVKIWDQEGRSSEWSEGAWFETGLLNEGDWAGAAWLMRPVVSPNLNDWTNYTVTVEFTLQSRAFGVFLRTSADGQNAYMMQVDVTGSTPVFKPHRRTNGAYSVLATVGLSGFGFTNAGLTGTRNTLRFDVSGTTITTSLNGVTIDTRTGIALPSGVVGFRTDGTEAGLVHRVTVVDNATNTTMIDPAFAQGANGFSGGVVSNGALSLAGTIDAIYGNLPPSLPLFRGGFVAREGIVSARLYSSAQGLYEVSVNGQKAGDQFLAPGWTNYNKRIQAQTYDITSLVHSGANAVGAALADGWFRGSVGLNWTLVYGTQLAFVAKIKVVYADGSSEWFSTNTDWKAGDSPYVQGDLQDGETYDANLEQAGWDTTTFDDSTWKAVETIPSVSARLVPQPDAPVRMVTVLTAKSRTEILPQTWIYDLGQNMVGVPRVVLSGVKGQTVTLKHAEEVYRTGAQTGQIYTANLRTAAATDTYTFAATGTVTYQPKFTQHGFRYIQITGTTTPPAVADVKGVVLSSDLAEIGDLQTSNSLLNQLVSNIRWGQRGNFLSIPTDTPARDERLGWTGDINVFAPAAARYKDTRAFLSKWMDDVRDAQKGNGNIPAVVPQPRTEFDDTGVGWADAFITIPYNVWKGFDDPRIVRQNWSAMKAFYQFVYNSATGDGDLLEQGRSSWFSGDWLSLEANWNRLEEHKVIATAYFAEDTRMMSEMAAAMGDTTLAANWAALVPQIRAAFVTAYCKPDGSIYQGTQTAYAMALGMDMIADPTQRALTATKFLQKLAADNNHLRTGFLGTPWLLPALSKVGRNDLAMQLLLNQDYPSWGFPISIGATTMWERWNSIKPDLTFGPVDMNSFNHYAYGAVGDWMFGNLGGLQAEESGYKKSRIAPLIGYGGLTQAHCTQDTAFGRLSSEWNVSGGRAVLQVQIPVNTTATIYVPASNAAGVTEGSVPADTAPGVQFLRMENGAAVYAVGSGNYVFTSTPPLTAPTGLAVTTSSMKTALTWNSALLAAGYNIKRATVPGGPYATIASNVTSTSFTDTGLANGVTYYYVVSSVNASGESANSDEVNATPRLLVNAGFEAPVTSTYVYNPSGGGWTFSPQSGNNGSGLTANGSLFSSGSANAPEGLQAAFLQGNGSITQVIGGLTPGVTYNVLFSAAQRATGSNWNLTGETWNVTIDGAIIASYAPGQAATTYAGYSATFTATAATHTLAFVGTKTTDNTIFLDNVRLVRAAASGLANGGFETPATGTFVYNPTGASWTFSAQSGNNGAGIARNASVFTASNSAAPEGVQVAFLQGTGSATQAISGLIPGTTYNLLFSAAERTATSSWNTNGQTWKVTLDGATIASYAPAPGATAYTGYSATFTATATTQTIAFVGTNIRTGDNTVFIDDVRFGATAPPAPTGLTATAGNMQVSLQWNAVGNVLGYHVKRTGGGPSVTWLSSGPAFTDSSLANGTTYTYTVSAFDEGGDGASSIAASATPVSPPITESEKSAPGIALTANGGAGQDANLTLHASVLGHLYQLQYTDDLPSGVWQNVPGVPAKAGTGGDLQFVAPMDSQVARRFFRISIQP